MNSVPPFRAPWWCRGPHCQTIWPNLFRRSAPIVLRRERIELPDGDFIDIDWTQNTHGPIALILHGLEGSARSGYARALLKRLADSGWCAGVMHFRGCSGEPNRLPRSYHSGDTADVAFVIDLLKRRTPDTRIAAVGFSLGGNVLLKWLGETGAKNPLDAAVAVSVPFVLSVAADRLDRGLSRLYQWKLLLSLRQSVRRKFKTQAAPIDLRSLPTLKNFWAFDDKVTAPLHGFDSAEHYYRVSSSRGYLRNIAVPTLILHALDDPFMSPHCVPDATELSPSIQLEVYPQGGHVGFIYGQPWRPRYWLDERIAAFLNDIAHRARSVGY